MEERKRVVLGFSGGLDTSFCVKYLTKELNYDVVTLTVNTGGFSSKELQDVAKHAINLGAVKHISYDAVEDYYNSVVKYLVFGNVLKNGTYPLCVSSERLTQAIALGKFAKEMEADAVAHGSTGAGNDQVRFDMIIHITNPGLEIITPIRDLKLSREQEIEYLKKENVKMNFEKSAYSINKGLWGTSVGGKETLTSATMLPESAWPTQVTKTTPEKVTLEFVKGELVSLNGVKSAHPSAVIQELNKTAQPFGIGRDVHVGDTIIGIKGRVGFEAAAPLIILKAHYALEKHVLTKWQLYWKDSLAQFYGNWLHDGQIMDPVMRDIEKFFENSQEHVTGKVFVSLNPYRFVIDGIESKYDLMNSAFGSYGEMNKTWSGDDVKGFTKIFGNQLSIYHQITKAVEKD